MAQLPVLDPQPHCARQRQTAERKQNAEADFQNSALGYFSQVSDFARQKTGSKSVDRRAAF
jgi:hypothetical protein